MLCEWDENKRQANIVKHGLDFVDAARIFEGPHFSALDLRADYGEDRWIGIGWIDDIVVRVVYTEPDVVILDAAGVVQDYVVRIISLRKAVKHEREQYEEFLANELGAGAGDD